MRILIITGGSIDEDFAAHFINSEKFDIIIVVDGALNFIHQLILKKKFPLQIDHLVGDFDSVDAGILEKYIGDPQITVHQFMPEKDHTDTEMAMALGMDLCADKKGEIYLLGAAGTRMDHLIANIHALLGPFRKGIPCSMIDKNNRIRLIAHTQKISKNRQWGKYISLLPLSPVLKGLDLEGFKYPLRNKTLYLGDSLGVSNELLEDEGLITIKEGIAILIESGD